MAGAVQADAEGAVVVVEDVEVEDAVVEGVVDAGAKPMTWPPLPTTSFASSLLILAPWEALEVTAQRDLEERDDKFRADPANHN